MIDGQSSISGNGKSRTRVAVDPEPAGYGTVGAIGNDDAGHEIRSPPISRHRDDSYSIIARYDLHDTHPVSNRCIPRDSVAQHLVDQSSR
jgi:hypothetical protein